MKRRSILLITSCLVGILSAALYASRIQEIRNEISGLTERAAVLVTNRQILPGEILTSSDLTKGSRSRSQISQRAVDPEDADLIVGGTAFHPLPAGEVLLWTDVPEGPRLRKPSERIPPGYRAFSLPADEIHTLIHFLAPGDRVDILSSRYAEETGNLRSRIVAENIEVLSVGERFDEWARNASADEYPLSVTLLGSQSQATGILNASQSGEIHFLARGSQEFLTSGAGLVPGGPEKGYGNR